MPDQYSPVIDSVKRMQEFDINSLQRSDALGSSLHFAGAVDPARRIVNLYKQLTLTVIPDLPPQLLEELRLQANSDYSRFAQILSFDPNQGHTASHRDSFTQQLGSVRKVAFLLHLVDLKVLCTKGRQRFGGGYHAAASTH